MRIGRIRRKHRARCRGRDGFLLVEALATLAISAAILAGLASVMGLMLRQADLAATRTDRLEREGRSLDALSRDIRAILRVRWAGLPPRSYVFRGEPDRIVLARARRGESGLRDTVAVILQSTDHEGGGRILRSEARLPPGATAIEQLRFDEPRTLYDGRSLIRFAYVGRGENGGPETLTDAWPVAGTLPVAVRIALVDPVTDALLSTLRVPILVEAEPGCANPGKAFCSHGDGKGEPEGEGPAAETVAPAKPSYPFALGAASAGRR